MPEQVVIRWIDVVIDYPIVMFVAGIFIKEVAAVVDILVLWFRVKMLGNKRKGEQ